MSQSASTPGQGDTATSQLPVLRRLWAAVSAGDEAQMRELVAAGADVNAPIGNAGGETPLIRAITEANTNMVKALIELGADVNRAWQGPRSWTPLMFAHAMPEVIELLVRAGADVNARATAVSVRVPSGRVVPRPGGETALHVSAAAGNAAAVRTLLRLGADVDARTEAGEAPLDYALRMGTVTEAAEALVEAGAQLTPQRLELMHSAAHRPDSDLLAFPFAEEDRSPHEQPSSSSNRTLEAPPEFRCPSCHSLIYSRKPKICGCCGAMLPSQLLLTDLQAQAMADERGWARELADKFTVPQPSSSRPARQEHTQTAAIESLSTEDLLRRVSCSDAFRRRDRPEFWVYVVAYAFMFFIIGFVPLQLNLLPPKALLLLGGIFAFLCWHAWHRASPICPNCRRNVRSCAPAYCQNCGGRLTSAGCPTCATDDLSTRWIPPRYRGANVWIIYCPGCGVQLDSKLTRQPLSSGRRFTC